jgi:capsular exopolysaccharide synthesis family protein
MSATQNSLDKFDIGKTIQLYTRKWKWFLISLGAFFLIAIVYLRYAVPKYASLAKIQILLDDNSKSPELSLFKDVNRLAANNSLIDDEIEVLNSRSNFVQVAKNLNLNIGFFIKGNIRDTELYGTYPLRLNFLAPDSTLYNSKTKFFIEILSSNKFIFTDDSGKSDEYLFGNTVKTKAGSLVITPNTNEYGDLKGHYYEIAIKPLFEVAEVYKKKTIIVQSKEYSSIIHLKLDDPVPNRGRDILAELIRVFNENTIKARKEVADKTSSFINDRIAEIYSNLSEVEDTAENFKSDRGLADIASQASVNISAGAENQRRLQDMSTQLSIANSMRDFLETQAGYETLPANIGLQDNSIASTTDKYNQLAIERRRLLESSNEKNPTIVNLDKQLEGLKESLQSSLIGMSNNLNLQVSNLENQLSRINSKIYSAPKNERALRDITRQQQTKESLYLYLLQKREESQITFASKSPKSSIVDQPYSITYKPISPKPSIVFLSALVLSLLLPVSIIYVNSLLDNKIHNKRELEEYIKNVPVLAEIPKLGRKEFKIASVHDRSVLAESLRILRENLDYLLKSKRTNQKANNNIVFITSSVSGEGKTFIALNLASMIAATKKSVLLIGADIRNPRLQGHFPEPDNSVSNENTKQKGLSEFLLGDGETKDIIVSTKKEGLNLDIIYSGKIPPNPTELLSNERIGELFEHVSKKYDYVLVDTAPVIPVSDTLLLSKYANQFLYVIKAGSTDKKVLDFPLKLKEDKKISNLAFVVNYVKGADLGYGGKYGYGYGVKKTFFQRVFSTS